MEERGIDIDLAKRIEKDSRETVFRMGRVGGQGVGIESHGHTVARGIPENLIRGKSPRQDDVPRSKTPSVCPEPLEVQYDGLAEVLTIDGERREAVELESVGGYVKDPVPIAQDTVACIDGL